VNPQPERARSARPPSLASRAGVRCLPGLSR